MFIYIGGTFTPLANVGRKNIGETPRSDPERHLPWPGPNWDGMPAQADRLIHSLLKNRTGGKSTCFHHFHLHPPRGGGRGGGWMSPAGTNSSSVAMAGVPAAGTASVEGLSMVGICGGCCLGHGAPSPPHASMCVCGGGGEACCHVVNLGLTGNARVADFPGKGGLPPHPVLPGWKWKSRSPKLLRIRSAELCVFHAIHGSRPG